MFLKTMLDICFFPLSFSCYNVLFRSFLDYFLVNNFCFSFCFGNFLIFVFDIVYYALVMKRFFEIYCFCCCYSLRIGILLSNYKYLLLASRLLGFSKVDLKFWVLLGLDCLEFFKGLFFLLCMRSDFWLFQRY